MIWNLPERVLVREKLVQTSFGNIWKILGWMEISLNTTRYRDFLEVRNAMAVTQLGSLFG
jgi:hypothetical protein